MSAYFWDRTLACRAVGARLAPHAESTMPRLALLIRKAGPTDLDALVETRAALFRELGGGAEGARLDVFRAACREALARGIGAGAAVAWLATTPAGHMHGAAVLLVFPRLPAPLDTRAREGYLLNVYVAPEHRRQGVATSLVDAALAEARALGLARVRLHATDDGRSVYAGRGFHARGDEMELVLPPDESGRAAPATASPFEPEEP